MARCQICSRKIPPTRTHCGSGEDAGLCIADLKDYIPRCRACGGLAIESDECPGGFLDGNAVGTKRGHYLPEGVDPIAYRDRSVKVM